MGYVVRANIPVACQTGTRILHDRDLAGGVNDETVVHSWVPGEELILPMKVRPAAIARITLRLNDLPGGQCRVAISEAAASRPLSWVPDGVQLLRVAPRNRECTWRFGNDCNNTSQMPSIDLRDATGDAVGLAAGGQSGQHLSTRG
jgi:hypothetical protein